MRIRSIPFSYVLIALGLLLLAVVLVYTFQVRQNGRFERTVWPGPAGDPERGRLAIERHGCGACHVIEGIRQARGRVGPKLVDLHEQSYIAGVLPNDPENLAAWITHPQRHAPGTAMPDLGVTPDEALDIASHLLRNARTGR